MTQIVHLISESDWSAAKQAGEWRPPSLATEGFIHCSRPEQVASTIRRHFPDRSDILMLLLDPARIDAEIRDEDLNGRGETFPHIYGPLNVNAVVDVRAADVLPPREPGALSRMVQYVAKPDGKVRFWASNRVLDRLHPAVVMQAGWVAMLFALVFSTITMADSDYRNELLMSMGLVILADVCLLNSAFRTRGIIRGLSFLGMVPSLFVLWDFARRAPNIDWM